MKIIFFTFQSPLIKNKYDASACLNYFLNNVSHIQGNSKKIIIRPHPKENVNKIKNIKKKFPKLKSL